MRSTTGPIPPVHNRTAAEVARRACTTTSPDPVDDPARRSGKPIAVDAELEMYAPSRTAPPINSWAMHPPTGDTSTIGTENSTSIRTPGGTDTVADAPGSVAKLAPRDVSNDVDRRTSTQGPPPTATHPDPAFRSNDRGGLLWR